MGILLAILKARATWYILAILSVVGGLIYYGYNWASDKCQEEKVAALLEAQKLADVIAAQDAEVINWHIANNKEIETKYKVINHEINVYKPIVGKCFDPIGVSMWNRASEAATDPGLFDNAMSESK